MTIKPFLFLAIALQLLSCARRGNPEGGPKDENAPILITSSPTINSTNFKDKEIKIYFDEYVVLKDVREQLVVSPPLKYPLIISPQGLPSKRISIKIKDTLQANTTYVFNFGNSIQDNNEGNILTNFKYVFSTGKHIDSLKLNGTIKDAFAIEPDNFVSVMLYKANEKFNDSTIFKEKPFYVANTLDSIYWSITNIKEGKYHLIAIKDKNSDLIFQPKEDKIAFLDTLISLPTNKQMLLKLFKETPNFSIKKPEEITKGHLIFGYYGDAENLQINEENIYTKNQDSLRFKSYLIPEKNKDSIHYYYTANMQIDSINFTFINKKFTENITTKIRLTKLDSLTIKNELKGFLHPKDTFSLITNNPILSVVDKRINLFVQDTIPIDFTTKIKELRTIQVVFDREPSKNYTLEMLPNGITDIFKQVNDTLNYKFSTKKETYYGSIDLQVNINEYPIIVQILDDNYKIIEEKYATEKKNFLFDYLIPQKYNIRVIVDSNGNKKWDTGNYLKKIQPEKVYYYPNTITVKQNFYLNQQFDVVE